MQLNKKIIISLIIILISFFLDRVSKMLIINFFSENQLNEYYVNSFLNLVLVWNQGVAFGLLQLEGYYYHSVSFFIITIIVFIFYLVFISNKKISSRSSTLIIYIPECTQARNVHIHRTQKFSTNPNGSGDIVKLI